MKWLYEKNDNNTSRYVLGTVGNRPLVCIGINPSTAEPNKLDHTLQSVARISEANGFDSWIMLNIYPQRSTDPNGIDIHRKHSICEVNLVHIEKILKEYNPTIWAAWGVNIIKRPYLINCLHEIANLADGYDCRWVEFGNRSMDGHPHHPLYLKKSSSSCEFELKPYLVKAAIYTVFSYINLRDLTKFSYSEFYKTVEYSDFLDFNYGDHLSTHPICIAEEIKMLKNADFQLVKALLTAMLREDHFCNGSFERRLENRDVSRVIRKLKCIHLSGVNL